MDIDFSALQWLYVAIVAPLLGWVGGWFRSWFLERRKANEVIAHLCGLPLEAKAELVQFNFHGSHTLRCDPMSPPVRLLIDQGVLRRGPGGGSYDAVDSYLTVRADIWKVMDTWVRRDKSIIPVLEEFLEKTNHDDSPHP